MIRMPRRPWAWPLVPVYAAGLWLKRRLASKPKRLQQPVISIGSISAGGAGKTPVVIALAQLLQQHGYIVDVLSRGYGRNSKDIARVDLTTDNPAERFGDEPTLIAQQTNAPVWVGPDRYTAGLEAEKSSEPWALDHEPSHPGPQPLALGPIHLLDDGFQHQQLARSFDIVLVTLEDLDDALLPAGNRREPLSSLRRADAILVRQNERDRVIPRLKPLLAPQTPIWVHRRQLHFASQLGVLGAGLRPLAFCAIARPAEFAATVQAAGCGLVDTLFFPDHHRYTAADLDTIVATAQKLHVTGFVTTEKDAVKLTPAMHERLASIGPLLIAELSITFGDPVLVLDTLRERIGERIA